MKLKKKVFLKSQSDVITIDNFIYFIFFFFKPKVCQIIESQLAGVVGPTRETNSKHIQSICDTFEIPHLQIRPEIPSSPNTFSINLFPNWSLIARAIIDLIIHLGWKEFAVIYEDDEGLLYLLFYLFVYVT